MVVYNRRSILSGLSLTFAAGPAFSSVPSPGQTVTVETENGKVRGLIANGAMTFKGIGYAADTSGPNRFMAPRPVEKWTGVRDAFQFGDRAPQGRTSAAPRPTSAGHTPVYGENCCVLNVYTPNNGSADPRPVMVFIHGGGFRGGSSDGPELEGSRLATYGNAVVVTLNRRLNVLGYASLGHLDPQFVDSANVGQLDLLAALQWIQANIGAFGGDPGRVMVFGVSGGGSAIEALKVMPGAVGLFNRSINMSGSSAFAMKTAADMEEVTAAFLARFDIGPSQLRRLQEIPPDTLREAYDAAFAATSGADYRPVVDGIHILDAPMTPTGLTMSSRLPSVMTYTATEATLWLAGDARNVAITAEQLQRRIGDQFGLDSATASAVMDGYREKDPSSTPWEILVALSSDALVRTPLLRAAEARAFLGQAPVYVSQFAWMSPTEGGVWAAPHAIDVPFAFGNIDHSNLVPAGDHSAAETALNQMSAFVAFARSADPNNDRMPHWTPYDARNRRTMIVNETCNLVDNIRSGERRAADLIPQMDAFQIVGGPLFRPSASTQCSSGGCWN